MTFRQMFRRLRPLLRRFWGEKRTGVWDAELIVNRYAQSVELYPPERDLLRNLSSRSDGPLLGQMAMLDLGIGAGRTTRHFAGQVQSYIGVDLSEKMVDACRRGLVSWDLDIPTVELKVSNAAHLSDLPDESFDFVMFSFNGLDCLTPEDRLLALREIRRVCRPGAIFYFSSHNLRSVTQVLALKVAGDDSVASRIRKTLRWLLLWALNPSKSLLPCLNYAVITDGVHRFELDNYYIRPEYQLEQLQKASFSPDRVYRLDGTCAWAPGSDPWWAENLTDFWLCYSCRAV